MNNRGDLINGAVLGSGNNIPNVRFGASQASCGAVVSLPNGHIQAAGFTLLGAIGCRAVASSRGSRRLVGKVSSAATVSAIPKRRVGRLRGVARVTATVSLEMYAKGMLSESLACAAACSGGFHPEFDELVGSVRSAAFLRGRLAASMPLVGYGKGIAQLRGRLAASTIFAFAGCGNAQTRGVLAQIDGFSFHEQGNASVRGLLTGGEIYYG